MLKTKSDAKNVMLNLTAITSVLASGELDATKSFEMDTFFFSLRLFFFFPSKSRKKNPHVGENKTGSCSPGTHLTLLPSAGSSPFRILQAPNWKTSTLLK